MIALVETALRGAHGPDREAFLLFAVEGFTPEEIAMIEERPLAKVHASIQAARDHLRKPCRQPESLNRRRRSQ